MQKQLYPLQTPSDASTLATRNNGVALCQAPPPTARFGATAYALVQITCIYAALNVTGALKHQVTRNAVHGAMAVNYSIAAAQSELARRDGCDPAVATVTTALMAGMAGLALRTLLKEKA